MSGSIRNVFIRNVTVANVKYGINIKTCRGRGGVIENVHISDVTITNKSREYSIHIYPFYDYGCMKNAEHKVTELTPHIRDIFINNVTGSSKHGFTVAGLPEKHFSNIHIQNVHLTADEREVITDVDGLLLTNFTYHHLGK